MLIINTHINSICLSKNISLNLFSFSKESLNKNNVANKFKEIFYYLSFFSLN